MQTAFTILKMGCVLVVIIGDQVESSVTGSAVGDGSSVAGTLKICNLRLLLALTWLKQLQ